MRHWLALFLWYGFARFLPGHSTKSRMGRFRSAVGLACLASAGKGSAVGAGVDFASGKNVHIGTRSGISDGSLVKGAGPIYIGNRVVMGPGVMIFSSGHRYAVQEGEWRDQRFSSPVTIHDEVFIGARAVILAGVSVGPRSVVAAGSVVTRDVPPGKVVGGVPARVIADVPGYASTTTTPDPEK